jgi:glycosyltransferase involved in cell wall biosynthesis
LRIAVLTSRFPYPLERGDKLRIFHQIKQLSEDHEIFLFSVCDQVPSESDMAEMYNYCKRIEYIHVDVPTLVINIIKNYQKDIPLQCLGLYESKFHERIKAQIIRYKIDIMYCQLYRMAMYAQGIKIPSTLDYMDAFGVGMERRVNLSPWYVKWIYKLESNRIKQFENKISTQFEAFTIISEQDKNLLHIKDSRTISVVPNGIDNEYFTPSNSRPKYDLVFVGNLGYLPNVEAVEILVNEILKKYNKKYNKKITCLIAGARPSLRLLKIQSEYVTLSGWREDIRSAYNEGKIHVAPLFNGTGQQNKILEAMAMGRPCITTSFVNNAINAEHGGDILIADTVDNMVSAIHVLLNDSELYDKIQFNALKFVKNNYNWKEINEKLNFIFASLIKQST